MYGLSFFKNNLSLIRSHKFCSLVWISSTRTMANTKFSYVRTFETNDSIAPEQWIVISLVNGDKNLENNILPSRTSRIKFTELMAKSTRDVLTQFKDVKLSYIHWHSVHLVFDKSTTAYQRRCSKLLSYLASCFSSACASNWATYMDTPASLLNYSAEVHAFPSDQLLRDFLTMKQSGHHIVNLRQTLSEKYLMKNVTSSALEAHIKKEMLSSENQSSAVENGANSTIMEAVSATDLLERKPLEQSSFKEADISLENEKKAALLIIQTASESYCNETLFSEYSVNYNNEPEPLKKGCMLVRHKASTDDSGTKVPSSIHAYHEDLKKEMTWKNFNVLSDSTKLNIKFNTISKFTLNETLLPHAWIVVRVDGKAFHKLSKEHDFQKPNDIRAIELMNVSAAEVMNKMPSTIIGFGESDEFSFVFDRYGADFSRSSMNLVSQCVSLFTSSYVKHWPDYMVGVELKLLPVFDGRCVTYPTNSSLRDYLSWRQADCHINNMYNTAFWGLVNIQGNTNAEAEKILCGTFSKDKLHILEKMGIEYSNEPAIHRKGSVLYRKQKTVSTPADLSLKSNSPRKFLSNPWFDEKCHTLRMERTRLRKEYLNSPSVETLEKLFSAELQAKKVFNAAKKNYFLKKDLQKFIEGGDNTALETISTNLDVNLEKSPSETIHSKVSSDMNNTTTTANSRNVALSNVTRNGKTLKPPATAANGLDCTTNGTTGDKDRLLSLKSLIGHGASDEDEEKLVSWVASFDLKGKPWWTLECHVAKMARAAAKSAVRENPTKEMEIKYREASSTFIKTVKQAKLSYKKNPKQHRRSITDSLENDPNGVKSSDSSPSKDPIETPSLDHTMDRNVKAFDGDQNSSGSSGLSSLVTPAIEPQATSDSYTSSDSPSAQDKIGNAEALSSSSVTVTLTTNMTNSLDSSSTPGAKSSEINECEVSEKTNGTSWYVHTRASRHASLLSNAFPQLTLCYEDIIGDHFWKKNRHLLGKEKSSLSFEDN